MLIAHRHIYIFTKKTSLNGLNIITLTAKKTHIYSKKTSLDRPKTLLAAQGKPLKGHKASLDRPVPEVFTRGNVGLILIYLVCDDDVELNVLRCRADILGTVWSPSKILGTVRSPSNSWLKTDHSQNDGDGEERGGRGRGEGGGGGGCCSQARRSYIITS